MPRAHLTVDRTDEKWYSDITHANTHIGTTQVLFHTYAGMNTQMYFELAGSSLDW